MRIAIGSDHAGFELKEAMKTFLLAEHHEVVDVGTPSLDPVNYPDYAPAVGTAVRESRAARGILLCGSGVGAPCPHGRPPGPKPPADDGGSMMMTDEKPMIARRTVACIQRGGPR